MSVRPKFARTNSISWAKLAPFLAVSSSTNRIFTSTTHSLYPFSLISSHPPNHALWPVLPATFSSPTTALAPFPPTSFRLTYIHPLSRSLSSSANTPFAAEWRATLRRPGEVKHVPHACILCILLYTSGDSSC